MSLDEDIDTQLLTLDEDEVIPWKKGREDNYMLHHAEAVNNKLNDFSHNNQKVFTIENNDEFLYLHTIKDAKIQSKIQTSDGYFVSSRGPPKN